MRILQIAPPWESVPPAAYGGTEAVVYLLCEELIRLGHDVTLWASGDSSTSARLRWCVPQSLRTAPVPDPMPLVWNHVTSAIAEAKDYDLVHNHGGEEVMALAGFVPDTPMLTTTHCNVTAERRTIWDNYDGYYNTISHAQKGTLDAGGRARFVGVAYNGINVRSFPFCAEKDPHLLFLSRMAVEKGPHVAIEIARRAGKRLLMAGKVGQSDRAYFEESVKPHIDGEQIVFLGEADAAMKRLLYKSASCLLLPILWEEPFGLVMAEAQACGTPVVTFHRGAATELVHHQETGLVVDTVDEMVDAVGRVREIDPSACRRFVAERFDSHRMAERYVELYGQVLSGSMIVPATDQLAASAPVDARRLGLTSERVA
jgi:glycosyltransferase involved in cell wall biosynthesis